MEFFDTSSHAALYFRHRDHYGDYHWVVVMRVTAKINEDGSLEMIAPPPPLNIAELAHGDITQTSLVAESDLAPNKSKVDLIVNGTAYAPGGKSARRFSVSLTVREKDKPLDEPLYPNGINPFTNPSTQRNKEYQQELAAHHAKPYSAGKILHQKKLNVVGPRYWRFYSRFAQVLGWIDNILFLRIINNNDWVLSRPQLTTEVPLQYDLAYGGTVNLTSKKETQKPAMMVAHPDNPVGSGYIPTVKQIKQQFKIGIFKANNLRTAYCRKIKKIQAPQIEIPGKPIKRIDKSYPLAGWGIVSKHWALRLKKAGTFDQEWIDHRHPLLPTDFDPNYWNGAHPDLQFDHLPENAVIELQNLVPHTRIANQKIRICLPEIYPQMQYLEEDSDKPICKDLEMDTVKIDLDENQLTLLYRASFIEKSRGIYIHVHDQEIK